MKVKEESEKVGLKFSIPKTKIMASGPITLWQIDGETVETVSDFYFLGGSKITAYGDCSHEIKRHLLLGRKVLTNLDSILKSRDITLPKGPSSQGYGFSSGHVWMWELDCEESWVPKNCCFWTVVLEKTLENPMNCSLSGSSVHGIFQARVLEWAAISFSRESSQPRDRTWVSHILGRRFTIWATREVVITT